MTTYEIETDPRFVYVATNGKSGDQRVDVYIVDGVYVATTNGNPVWSEEDPEAFDALIDEEGINLR